MSCALIILYALTKLGYQVRQSIVGFDGVAIKTLIVVFGF